jgi:hypothetical protein
MDMEKAMLIEHRQGTIRLDILEYSRYSRVSEVKEG